MIEFSGYAMRALFADACDLSVESDRTRKSEPLVPWAFCQMAGFDNRPLARR
ncbi:hypothetical protein [Sulfitobacter sp.]|jgi:hypothetical protein|uniref:hypothetical protein n=1 Tax=Sulfitobacter sp. TaxID=1903071 RepID=UPI0026D8F557|tara:strand:- start:129 stop:284 length:156 start_codon:yes stop_codon:yes gene_type:complete